MNDLLCIKPLVTFGILFIPIMIGIIKNVRGSKNDS